MKGTLETFALEEVIQIISETKKSGRIDIQGSHGQYGIYINKDSIYHSYSPHFQNGINALLEAFLEKNGSFEFREFLSSKFISITKPMLDIITEGLSIREELGKLNEQIFDDTTFDTMTDINLDSISISSNDLKLLRAIGKGLNTATILKEDHLDYISFLRQIKYLIDKGLIRIKDKGR